MQNQQVKGFFVGQVLTTSSTVKLMRLATSMANSAMLCLILHLLLIAVSWPGTLSMIVSPEELTTPDNTDAGLEVWQSSSVQRHLLENSQKDLFDQCVVDLTCSLFTPARPTCCKTPSIFSWIPNLIGTCANIFFDSNNCGNCNFKCPSVGSNTCCFAKCTSTLFDNNNCAFCGIKCPNVGNSTCCFGTCSNVSLDSNNCGGCGIKCSGDNTCCSGNCTNTLLDSNNCGGCGLTCLGGNPCCSGKCLNIITRDNNCGTCGNRCLGNSTCCSGQCVNTATDMKICGSCGGLCTTYAGSLCCNGSCCLTPPGPAVTCSSIAPLNLPCFAPYFRPS